MPLVRRDRFTLAAPAVLTRIATDFGAGSYNVRVSSDNILGTASIVETDNVTFSTQILRCQPRATEGDFLCQIARPLAYPQVNFIAGGTGNITFDVLWSDTGQPLTQGKWCITKYVNTLLASGTDSITAEEFGLALNVLFLIRSSTGMHLDYIPGLDGQTLYATQTITIAGAGANVTPTFAFHPFANINITNDDAANPNTIEILILAST